MTIDQTRTPWFIFTMDLMLVTGKPSTSRAYQAPFTRSRFHGETAMVLYGSAFRTHEAGESADRNRKLLKPPSEVVSNLPGFVLESCLRLKPTETANHDVIAPPLDLLANGS